ncbi:hypothetical protein [Elizabethkingia argenteiflava]|uniref:hypothetical protein n=1 Tax=Elizabethkingia argenteiflava TaxID=2681556 RepID=UPI001FCEC7F4|nr:hypothetical protein [Elizabethkingia argenteiflava]
MSIRVLLAGAVGLVTVVGIFGLRKLAAQHESENDYDYLTGKVCPQLDDVDNSIELNAYL